MNLMHDDLGIGLRGKAESGAALLLTQCIVILNDTVMHQCDSLVANMRVGILLTRHAVCGPAGMCNTGRTTDRIFFQRATQFGDLADLAHAFQQVIFTLYRHSGRVVTAVFQPAQAIDQYRDYVMCCHHADYAAHLYNPLFIALQERTASAICPL